MKKVIVMLAVCFALISGTATNTFAIGANRIKIVDGFESVDSREDKLEFRGENTIIEVYEQNLDSDLSFESYFGYSNSFMLKKHPDIKLEQGFVLGYEYSSFRYEREKLSSIDEDFNNYLICDFKIDENRALTLIVKSTEEVKNIEDYVKSIESSKDNTESIFSEDDDKSEKNKVLKEDYKKEDDQKESRRFNEETQRYYEDVFLNGKDVFWGVFEPSAPMNMYNLNEMEEKLGYEFPVIVKYQGFSEGFPTKALENAFDEDKVVELTLQTREYGQFGEDAIIDILDGKYDDYFKKFGKEAARFEHPVLFRLNNEMNGDWCNYSTYYYFRDSKLFRDAWIHIHEMVTSQGADNIVWVWNPNEKSFPDFSWNNYMSYYPGDEYVDVVGLTGYNTGNYYPGETWRSFKEIYDEIYHDYEETFDKPLMVTEFGSNSVGGDKEKWIEDMFEDIDEYPNIKGFIWWNGTDWDQNGMAARKYRLDEDEKYMNEFKKQLKNFYKKEK